MVMSEEVEIPVNLWRRLLLALFGEAEGSGELFSWGDAEKEEEVEEEATE